MRNDETVRGSAASPADRSPSTATSGSSPWLGRRVLAWALHGPPWSYVALALAGLVAALLLAGLKS
jgi:hypothetical protein